MDENKDNATTTTAGVTPADTRVYKTPESQRAYMKAYYQAHKEQIKAYTTTWRKAHPEAVKRYNKKFNENQKKLRDEKRKAAMADAKPATPPTPKKKKAKRELLMTKRAICQRKWYARQKARKALAEKAAELGLRLGIIALGIVQIGVVELTGTSIARTPFQLVVLALSFTIVTQPEVTVSTAVIQILVAVEIERAVAH